MFHRVTTEDQNTDTTQKTSPEPANTNDGEIGQEKAKLDNNTATEQPNAEQERALFSAGERETSAEKSAAFASSKNTTASTKSTPRVPGKVSYSPHLSKTSTYSTQNRGQNTMTSSYTRTPATDTKDTDGKNTHDFSAGSYSRTRAGNGYPGASSYAANASRGSTSTSENDRTLTIGSGITMAGEIESCDYLLVEGTVEAALKGARSLEVAESGVFYGTVEIEEATIAGRFEGDITVHGRLTIQSTGIVTGSITYKELEIESGAIVDGRLTPVASMAQSSAPAPVSTKTRAKTGGATKTEAANTEDGALFAEGSETTAAE